MLTASTRIFAHEAGAHTAQAMSLDQILQLIRNARKVPVERDSFYNVIRTFDEPAPTSGSRPPIAA